ncbi:hypothetical protein MAR_030720 [Mya arenaria]|uniref:B box-type domain-containing protein n=1 Tax=Mya arenaria TaxID=6604 RepID=A0ABY7F509_MYAAR|nr:hypothetical protein MAR_030720 [Mya arenaria]
MTLASPVNMFIAEAEVLVTCEFACPAAGCCTGDLSHQALQKSGFPHFIAITCSMSSRHGNHAILKENKKMMADEQCNSALANDNTLCQPCQGEGEIKEGHGYCQNCQEYMCQHCIRIVHRSSNLKGHTILSGEQMPLIPPERDDHGSAEEYSEMCKVHANETLKFFCPDHGAFECGVCIVLDHRACSVQFVPDVAKGFSNTSEYRDQINMLREIQNDIQTCEDKVEEKSVSANDVHLVGLGDLKKFRKKINEYLDESERNIESFAEHLKAEVDEKIRELKKKYVQLKGIGDKSEQTLEIASSDEVRLYMTSTRSKKDIEGLKLSVDKIKKTCQQDNMRYEFKPDSVFEKMLSLQRNLGKMTITNEIQDDKSDNTADEFDIDESDQKCTLSDSITFDQVPSITNISIESTDDVYQTCSCKHPNCWKNEEEDHKKEVKEYWSCCITGMAVLSPGRLVVADSGCHSVKLIDTSNNKVLARYSTAPYPTQDGNTLATYTDWEFKSPGLVIPIWDGNILLYNNDKEELLLMSGNCEKIKSLMKIKTEENFIENPSATTFCSETKTLFVCDQQSDKTIKAIQFTIHWVEISSFGLGNHWVEISSFGFGNHWVEISLFGLRNHWVEISSFGLGNHWVEISSFGLGNHWVEISLFGLRNHWVEISSFGFRDHWVEISSFGLGNHWVEISSFGLGNHWVEISLFGLRNHWVEISSFGFRDHWVEISSFGLGNHWVEISLFGLRNHWVEISSFGFRDHWVEISSSAFTDHWGKEITDRFEQ